MAQPEKKKNHTRSLKTTILAFIPIPQISVPGTRVGTVDTMRNKDNVLLSELVEEADQK